jgi:hypothetical protein
METIGVESCEIKLQLFSCAGVAYQKELILSVKMPHILDAMIFEISALKHF